MALTLSFRSALDVIRILRSNGHDLRNMDSIGLIKPEPWIGKRWNMQQFDPSSWRWMRPSAANPLDVLAPKRGGEVRMKHIRTHTFWRNLPAHSILWLDEHSAVVSPELAFLQAATFLPFPILVLLGYELCGSFSRAAEDPLEGDVTLHIPPATSVEEIKSLIDGLRRIPGLAVAREALKFVSNHAFSAPESVLATIYSLPVKECGYGMGPITLNDRVVVEGTDFEHTARARYPDILFPFAPVGINYDGEEHLDIEGLVKLARLAERADSKEKANAEAALWEKLHAVRNKVVDDITRNRQLMAQGLLVLPATKENLYGWGNLDNYTGQLLACARQFYRLDTSKYERALNDTDKTRDRNALLASMLPVGRPWGASHGHM